jgi:hypothetical protein
MNRTFLPMLACALALVFTGCGPMQSPMPQRLPEESQKEIDACWDRAFTPAEKLDHQALLDVMVGTQAYQLGVDTFSLRAEKRITGGRVVMEVSFDRAKPEEDRFVVAVLDEEGRTIRNERYSRREVEATYDILFVHPQDGANAPAGLQVGEQPVRKAEREARWERIRQLFPENKPAPAPAPRRQVG